MEIGEHPMGGLDAYARIPSTFEATSVLEVVPRRGGGFGLRERPLPHPFRKDYDALPGNRPTDWPRRFDVSRWGLLAARDGRRLVGGAAIAFRTPGLDMLEGREDLAVLWDLRVAPDARRRGIGSALFAAALPWAAARGCHRLKVETQNVNVAACRLYERHGCRLGAVHRAAYPDLPDELQLLWYKELAAPAA